MASSFFCHVTSHAMTTWRCAWKLDAVAHGIETCYLDVLLHGVDPLGPKLRLSFLEVQKRNLLKKKG